MTIRRRAPRVLMTADAVGGVWTYALDLAGGLKRAGIDVTLAVLGPAPAEDQIADARQVEGLHLLDTGLELDWRAAERRQVDAAGRDLADLAAGRNVDLVHLNSPALAAGDRFAGPVLGACHSCLASWWAAVKAGPMPADFAWRAERLAEGLAACDGLIAPTRAFSEATARIYGIRPPRVAPNGRPSAARAIPAVREPVVLAAGRLWDEGKNIAVLDEAAQLAGASLRLAGPLAGPGGERIVLRHGRALGRLAAPALAAEMSRAQLFASAALYEPFGLAALEAANAGCALVLSDIPTHRELWEGVAMFADPRRPAAFAEAFEQLLRDGPARRRLAEQARARARRFTVERMTRATIAAYRLVAPHLDFGAVARDQPPAEAAA